MWGLQVLQLTVLSCNRRVIELFGGGLCVVTWGFVLIFCWYGHFCHRTEPDLFLFLPSHKMKELVSGGFLCLDMTSGCTHGFMFFDVYQHDQVILVRGTLLWRQLAVGDNNMLHVPPLLIGYHNREMVNYKMHIDVDSNQRERISDHDTRPYIVYKMSRSMASGSFPVFI